MFKEWTVKKRKQEPEQDYLLRVQIRRDHLFRELTPKPHHKLHVHMDSPWNRTKLDNRIKSSYPVPARFAWLRH